MEKDMIVFERNNPFPLLLFADDYGKFLMKTYSVNWSHLTGKKGFGFVEWSSIPRIFTVLIGKASTNDKILMKLLNIRSDFNIDIFFLGKNLVSSFLYVKEQATMILRIKGGSFFLLCAFVGQVSVLSAKKGHPHLAHIPLLALSDILYEQKVLTSQNAQSIQEIARVIDLELAKIANESLLMRYRTGVLRTLIMQEKLYTLWTRAFDSK
ncbi:hypothetical protein NPIL_664701 [Nephila pilipes]|uniref:Uncharacterized protein n=1 Tax=Nephila pilipes TaxID=299642 RepID=A0A8X6U9J3_NEPPI|nr:hypothetical protein NPIL_664701 [Nephila pilipes]